MNYEFKKGELNKLFNLNQNLKNIFTQYYILNDGMIVGINKLQKGKHFVISEYRLPFNNNRLIYEIDSKQLFDAVNKNKKKITSLSVENNKIYLNTDDTLFIIGEVITNKTIDIDQYVEVLTKLSSDDFEVGIKLSEDNNEALIKNDYINIDEGKYRTRITKEVIPGLKKSHDVSIVLYNHSTDKQLFHMTIKVIRDKDISYHIYTCLFM